MDFIKNGACDHRNYLCSGNRSGALDVPIYRKDKTANRRDIHFTFGITPTVAGFGLLLFMGKHGWGGKFLALFNTSIVFSWPATVIAAAVMSFPLMYMTTKGAFEQVDTNIEDAARTLGAGEWRVLYSVTLPMAWPGVLAGTILSFARALGEFGATLMVAGNIPGRTTTIPVAIYFAIVDGNMKQANILMIIVLCIALASLALLAYLKKPKPRDRGLIANPVPSDILHAGRKIDSPP